MSPVCQAGVAGCRAGWVAGHGGGVWSGGSAARQLVAVSTAVAAGQSALSGQHPGPVVAGQPGADQGAQVDGGAPAVQPGVVFGRTEVAQPDPVPAAGGAPGDDPLDHRPGAVGLLELFGPCPGADGAQQALVRVAIQRPAVLGGGALAAQPAVRAYRAEGDGAF